jgi:hypothetical protein
MESSEIKFWEHFLLYVEFYRIEYDLIESRIHSDISEDIYSGSIGRVDKKTIKKPSRRVVKFIYKIIYYIRQFSFFAKQKKKDTTRLIHLVFYATNPRKLSRRVYQVKCSLFLKRFFSDS